MPSKRQPSKQRRAAQNRAQRAQREARRARAGELSAAAESRSGSEESSSGGGGSTGRSSGGFLSNLLGGGGGGGASAGGSAPRPAGGKVIGGGFVSLDSEGKPLPGARAAFVAVVLVILGGLALVFVPGNEVDDRDEVVPASGQFRGLYIEARELLNPDAAPLETENVTLLELVGPAALLYALLPLLIVLGAYWMHRRMGRSLPLTVGMLVLAVLFMLLGGAGMFFIPALIALAVGSFQARRVELPARMAERAARRGEAPAADASDDDDEDIEDDLDDEDYEEEDYDDEDEEDFIDDEDFSTEDEDEDEAEEEGYGFASDKRK